MISDMERAEAMQEVLVIGAGAETSIPGVTPT
jgi:hypothetical protein